MRSHRPILRAFAPRSCSLRLHAMAREDVELNRAMGAAWRCASRRRRARAHALQRGSACDGGPRHRARCHPLGLRRRKAHSGLCGRNASFPSGGKADGVGAARDGIPVTLIADSAAGVPHVRGEHRCGDRRSGSRRRKRRCREQDRDLSGRRARAAARYAVLRGVPALDDRPIREERRSTFPSKSAARRK